jgi:hypothetical protein
MYTAAQSFLFVKLFVSKFFYFFSKQREKLKETFENIKFAGKGFLFRKKLFSEFFEIL